MIKLINASNFLYYYQRIKNTQILYNLLKTLYDLIHISFLIWFHLIFLLFIFIINVYPSYIYLVWLTLQISIFKHRLFVKWIIYILNFFISSLLRTRTIEIIITRVLFIFINQIFILLFTFLCPLLSSFIYYRLKSFL